MTTQLTSIGYTYHYHNIRHDYTFAMLEYHMEDANWSKTLALPSESGSEDQEKDASWMKTFGIPEGTEKKRTDGDDSWAKYFGIPTLEESSARKSTNKSANWDSMEVPSIHD